MDYKIILQKMNDFWDIVVNVWCYGPFGIELGKLITAASIFIFFLALRKIIAAKLLSKISKTADEKPEHFRNKIIKALEQPVTILPVIIGLFLTFEYLDLEGDIGDFGNQTIRTLIVFVIFWGFYNLINPFSFLFDKVAELFSSVFRNWLLKIIRFAFIFIGAATILEIWGIQVAPILAGLGLFGVAVALGAQDLFKNLISGLLVISEKRFLLGDWILVDGVVEGTVENIGFRSTLIRRFDKAPVYVPNSKLADSALTNFSKMTYRRISWHIGLEYCTTIDQLKEIRESIEKYIFETEAFVKPNEAAAFVRVDRFSDSSIDIMLYCFTKTTVWGEWLIIKEQLALRIKEIVEGAGSSFAFPSRTLYLSNTSGEKPEIFVPPSNK